MRETGIQLLNLEYIGQKFHKFINPPPDIRSCLFIFVRMKVIFNMKNAAR